MKEIIIFGGGGHASVVIDILKLQDKYRPSLFVLKDQERGNFLGLPVVSIKDALSGCDHGIVAIGENYIRSKIHQEILYINPKFNFINAIHPTAIISSSVKVGQGIVLAAGTILNANCIIEDNVIINTGTIIEHDCHLKIHSNLSPGVTIGGNCIIGKGSFLGIGATVSHSLQIGDYSVLGAHSLATKDIAPNEIHYGVPARFIRKSIWGDKIL